MAYPLISSQNKKWITLALCIATYIMVYLCRLNFSTAVLKIAADFSVTTAAMGAVGSLFFIAYAIGQLINGFVGDRVSPVRFIIIATLGTGLMNLLMSWADNLWLIRLCWVMNGYFQSVFWAACNRILSYYYSDGEHHIISTGMSLSMVASYLISWAVLGKLLLTASWQSYFLIPAIVAGSVLGLWFLFARFEKTVAKATQKTVTLDRKNLVATMNREQLWWVCGSCVFTGMVKEGIGLWAPVILLAVLHSNVNQSLLMIVLIPLGNFGGIVLTQALLQRIKGGVSEVLLLMMGALAIFAAGILLLKEASPYGAIIFTAAVSGLAMGCNSVLMSYLPLSYASQNIVSTLIGIFDSCAYVGAAISAYVFGVFLGNDNWQLIPVIWAIAGVLGGAFIAIRRHRLKKQEKTKI